MDNNEQNQDRKRGGLIDGVNSVSSFVNKLKSVPVIGSVTNFSPSSLGSPGGIMAWFGRLSTVGQAFLIVGIIAGAVLFFTLIQGASAPHISLGGGNNLANSPITGPGPACSPTVGSLDYFIPINDTTVLPQNPEQLKQQILNSWPNAQINNFDHIIQRSIEAGWNPSFLLTLWVEESGAQGVAGYSDAVGCDPTTQKDIDGSLNCVFNGFRGQTFEDLMCKYGGDGFHAAPCEFVVSNPNFPGGVKDWYFRISGGNAADSAKCVPADQLAQGSWPTSGLLTQGPLGAFDHADLKARTGWDSVDIASSFGTAGPPVYSSFAGTVSEAHSCVIDNTCSVHYGNYVIVNNGQFSTMYGHLSQIKVTTGQQVLAGDQIGVMGTTGNSTGVHLHWEFRGGSMTPPNIPQAITPLDCDYPNKPCTPAQINPGNPNSGV